jgi:hypothetical protein
MLALGAADPGQGGSNWRRVPVGCRAAGSAMSAVAVSPRDVWPEGKLDVDPRSVPVGRCRPNGRDLAIPDR